MAFSLLVENGCTYIIVPNVSFCAELYALLNYNSRILDIGVVN